MSVAHSAFRGAAWTVLTSVGSRGVSLVGTFILTHFLSPDTVGEVNVAFVAVLTASFLSHIGFGHYVVTRHDAGPAGVFHAMVLHMILGVVAFGVVIAIARPLGPLLHAPAMGSYVPGLALAFMLERVSIIPQRMCVRELRFRLTSITSSSAEVLFTVTTIALAAAGWGGHAIVWANVVRFGLLAVVYVTVVGRREWLQPVPLSIARFKDILRFGAPLWVGGVAHVGSRRWDNLLFGYFFGPGAVGLYNQAYNLADVPATVVGEQIGDVLLPSYAHMTTQERKDALVQFTALLALVIFPLAVGLGAIAPSVIVLLGDEWDGVAPMLVILSALSISRPVGWTISSYLTARGRTRSVMALELVNVVVLLPAVAVLGLLGGPLWACGGAGVSFTCMGVIGVWMVKKLDDIKMSQVLLGMLPPLLATLPMAAAVVGVRTLLRGQSSLLSLIAELATGVVVYVPSSLIIAPRAARDFLRMFREAILKPQP
jgi:lipopolysaccharide exporter